MLLNVVFLDCAVAAFFGSRSVLHSSREEHGRCSILRHWKVFFRSLALHEWCAGCVSFFQIVICHVFKRLYATAEEAFKRRTLWMNRFFFGNKLKRHFSWGPTFKFKSGADRNCICSRCTEGRGFCVVVCVCRDLPENWITKHQSETKKVFLAQKLHVLWKRRKNDIVSRNFNPVTHHLPKKKLVVSSYK